MSTGRPPRGWRVWKKDGEALIALVREAAPLLPVTIADELEERADRVEYVGRVVSQRLDGVVREFDFPEPRAAA